MTFDITLGNFTVSSQVLIQILTSFTGSFGFAMIFNLRRRFILPAAFAGMAAWAVYLVSLGLTDDILTASFISSIACSVFAEVMARLCRTPANQFLIIALIPLIPGASLYYTMEAIVRRDMEGMTLYGYRTLEFVFGITLGICLVSAFVDMLRKAASAKGARGRAGR
ncbi:MAG: threonine/serine exporter family protein [Anaerovoracaceae bacterium]